MMDGPVLNGCRFEEGNNTPRSQSKAEKWIELHLSSRLIVKARIAGILPSTFFNFT